MWYNTCTGTNSVGEVLFMSINKELSQREFIQRETGETHSPYEKELARACCVELCVIACAKTSQNIFKKTIDITT